MTVIGGIKTACDTARSQLDTVKRSMKTCLDLVSEASTEMRGVGTIEISRALVDSALAFGELHRAAEGFVSRAQDAGRLLDAAGTVETKAAALKQLTANGADLHQLVLDLGSFEITLTSHRQQVTTTLSGHESRSGLITALNDAVDHVSDAKAALRDAMFASEEGTGQVQSAG